MATAGVRRAAGRFRPRGELSTGGYFFGGGHGFSRVLEETSAPAPAVDAPETTAGREPPPPPPAAAASAMAARITPAVLFVTVMLAVVLLVSGLLHVLRRFFLKRHHAGAGGGDRLFFPGGGHDDGGAGGSGRGGGGLAQAAIDALPEFAYGELSGAAAANASSRKGKEKQAARPFDCAVCLCEFADHDRLRLLPACGHAFHLACIDVWLRSSATCPLCRTKLTPRHLAADPDVEEHKQQQEEEDDQQAPIEASSVVLPVRLGRFTSGDGEASAGNSSRIEAGRRSYSMGSYQYVLADDHLQVSVHMRHGGNAAAAASISSEEQHQQAGKTKVFARGDSFSVSKIWQWRGSKRLPVSLCADDGMPWAPMAKDQAAAHTRQQQHGDT